MNRDRIIIVDDAASLEFLSAGQHALIPVDSYAPLPAADEFVPFPKIARLSRDCTITEKLDGTNGQIEIYETTMMAAVFDQFCIRVVDDHLGVRAGSKSRWLKTHDDNQGFAAWVYDNAVALARGLGVGKHSGEFWGRGIQRAYGLTEKRFSLFNTSRWYEGSPVTLMPTSDKPKPAPACCRVVPVLYQGPFETQLVEIAIESLRRLGSSAVPGFMRPEGVVVYHSAANVMFKKTLEKDEAPKGKS